MIEIMKVICYNTEYLRKNGEKNEDISVSLSYNYFV